ncbi:hypothetical protein GCM10007978_24370 [Shewanella hanedai]|uniref:Uncharacterized protein n=1 Tax=Shewanella hanedai TaxID=25 RepID=A0A553JN67_SHEHA|nr:hypothetical protein [Shewanella hanedai]TRY13850.1 hypothetical protein FN961_13110 [Shewanella hanedai]GGI85826.1 hypothetical protein GCM10007978_24370 [Shewanella hanedai]
MGSALVDGAMSGFNMMERHQQRKNNNERLAMLDERDDQRYQDRQGRLSDLDKRDNERYQNTVDYRNQTAAETKSHRDWQKSARENSEQWAKDQKMMGPGWDYFRANGQVSPEHKEMFSRNPGYDPRTFVNPEARQKVKLLGEKLESVMTSGQMTKVNEPETIELFDQVFKDKFSSSVGKFDHVIGASIEDVSFAGFVPTNSKDGSVSFALKVQYDNGKSEIKPMTQGRSTDKDDPVLQMKPDELVATIRGKMMMADMIERPEYWDQMGQSMSGRKQSGQTQSQQQQNKTEANYRKEQAMIARDETNAIAKIESDSGMMEEDRLDAIKRVQATYKQRAQALDQSYGIESSEDGGGSEYQSGVDGLSVEDVVEKFMQANEGMTKEQALKVAMDKGHITNAK